MRCTTDSTVTVLSLIGEITLVAVSMTSEYVLLPPHMSHVVEELPPELPPELVWPSCRDGLPPPFGCALTATKKKIIVGACEHRGKIAMPALVAVSKPNSESQKC